MKTTKVTVAVPTFNRARLLKICLESILNQTYSDFRVLVLDNASTDDTQDVVDSISDQRLSYLGSNFSISRGKHWHFLESVL